MNEKHHFLIDHCKSEFYIYNFISSQPKTIEHQHDKGQLLYAEGGVLHVFINQKHWYIPGRCFIWIPPNVPHYILSHSSHIRIFGLYMNIFENDSLFYKTENVYMVDDLLREMIWYTEKWMGCYGPEKEAEYFFLKAIKVNLPTMCKSVSSFPIQHPYPKDERLIKIGQFLRQNLERRYNLEEIAKEFGMSSRTLSRLFKEDIGMSFVKFYRAIRISQALELMSENKLNVYEVAIKVGFISLSAFSNIFLRIMGIRPQDYINKLKKD